VADPAINELSDWRGPRTRESKTYLADSQLLLSHLYVAFATSPSQRQRPRPFPDNGRKVAQRRFPPRFPSPSSLDPVESLVGKIVLGKIMPRSQFVRANVSQARKFNSEFRVSIVPTRASVNSTRLRYTAINHALSFYAPKASNL